VNARPRVAIVGAGRMGQAILTGLLAAGWSDDELVAVDGDPVAAEAVRSLGVAVCGMTEAVPGADLIVVAVKPHQVPGALDLLRAHVSKGAAVLSLAAGVRLSELGAHLEPGTPVIRVMPNTPALVGSGMSALSAGAGCPESALAMARTVLGAVGKVIEVPETAQDAVTAVSGSGPAYLFYVAEAMIDAGVQLGLTRAVAHELTVQTMVGAAQMLVRGGAHPSVLRENVTSPGGATAAALHRLDEAAVRAAIANAMRACRDRSSELAGGVQSSSGETSS
jgi:pyrroline-5-carboxylate reductase